MYDQPKESNERPPRRRVNSRSKPGTSRLVALSTRELEVFEMIGQGWGTREIAKRLNLSIKTAESYRGRVKDKLNLSSASEVTLRAARWKGNGDVV